jgi:hypothetical protein
MTTTNDSKVICKGCGNAMVRMERVICGDTHACDLCGNYGRVEVEEAHEEALRQSLKDEGNVYTRRQYE